MIDLHNHTPLCHHATGEPREYVARARALGLREYGFSEHSPWMLQYEGEQIAPTEAEFDEYLRTMEEIRGECERAGGMRLRIGIEMDFRPGFLGIAQRMADRFEFDYHIGSVHNLGDWIFDHPGRLKEWEGRDVSQVYGEYFDAVAAMLEWDLVDIVGHLDLPKKFKHLPKEGIAAFAERIVPRIVDSGAVVEINTAGRDKPIGEFYPSAEIVAMLAKRRVPFTLGSDAHKPHEVGRYQKEALELLRANGVKEIVTFEKRKKIGMRV